MEEFKKNIALLAVPYTMLGGIYVLLFAATFGWDRGLLVNMVRHDYARGIVTYLFAVTTIGIAIVLVLFAILRKSSVETDKRFQRGKEVLTLLLGIFGTIVGFYFASDVKGTPQAETSVLQVTPPLLSKQIAVSRENITLTALANGGLRPYRYGVALGAETKIQYEHSARTDGWVVHQLIAPEVSASTSFDVKIGIEDSAGRIATASTKIEVGPKPPAPLTK
jgi:hypothetical protein